MEATINRPQPVHMMGLTPMRSDKAATSTTVAIRIANVVTIMTRPAVWPTRTKSRRYVGRYPVSMKSATWEVSTSAAQISIGRHCSTMVRRICCPPWPPECASSWALW